MDNATYPHSHLHTCSETGRRFYRVARGSVPQPTQRAARAGFVLNLGPDPNPWHNLHWVLPAVSRTLRSGLSPDEIDLVSEGLQRASLSCNEGWLHRTQKQRKLGKPQILCFGPSLFT